jgi:hypothetical protein
MSTHSIVVAVENGKDILELRDVLRVEPTALANVVQPLQRPMPKADDHRSGPAPPM